VDRVAITTFADVPAGTGLGSSGALITALLKALHVYARRPITTEELARLACEIEIEKCGLVGGKQDQYTSAYGGVNALTFRGDDSVVVDALSLSPETLLYLEESLMLFYTGVTHNSSEMQSAPGDLHETQRLGYRARQTLESGNMGAFAEALNNQWDAKKRRCPDVYGDEIERMRTLIMANGALGCKLIGSGGGGFLMAYGASMEHALHDLAMLEMGRSMIRVKFDFEGARVIA
jgi:D-glycero-alpha-D-manno-heptose-7-phosphate kinase